MRRRPTLTNTLVHRGFRHRRPQGCEGVARRVESINALLEMRNRRTPGQEVLRPVREPLVAPLLEMRRGQPAECQLLRRLWQRAGAAAGFGNRQPSTEAIIRHPHRTRTNNFRHSDGERKTVTALFADIKGSMELMEDLDPEEARAIVDPALRLMIDAVHRYDGYIVQSTGDGIFALFGAPVAHEDHPQRALYAALRMQEELRRYSANLRRRRRHRRSRAASESTPAKSWSARSRPAPVMSNTRRSATPPAWRRGCRRWRRSARSRSTEATRKLCEGYFSTQAAGPDQVKGVSEPVNVYRSDRAGTAAHAAAGRSAARAYASSWGGRPSWSRCAARSNWRARAMARSSPRWASRESASRACSSSSRRSRRPAAWCWRPTRSRTARLSAICRSSTCSRTTSRSPPRTTSATRREKVNGKIVMLDRALEDTLPYLFGLLGIVEGDGPAGPDGPAD